MPASVRDATAAKAVIEDPQGPVQDCLFLVGGRVVTADRDEGDDHGQAAAVCVGADSGRVLRVAVLFKELGCFNSLARVEDVQVPDSATEADDLSAEGPDGFDVLAFEVTKDQWVNALCGEADEHPTYDGGFPQSGLAQDEGRGVGNQARALEPADRVAADRGLGFFVASHRDADHG
ncbi:hypothetical protein StoSoilB3_43490 (plasmid) [Arthrobacter sp. StoSoilB3]|nr:hypothetical protein StoSoilB3_43490 [Arthrobacter sp. StoSoilB3]